MKHKFNWRPSRGDFRDHKFIPALKVQSLPVKVDMRHVYKHIFDQGDLGSCTANAAAAAVGFERSKQNLDSYRASRLFIYYNERVIENTVNYDSGAQIRDSINVLYKQGACREHMWEYDISQYKAKPDQRCYTTAAEFKIKEYLKIDNSSIDNLKNCLADGFAFIFGFTVFESFESNDVAETGMVPMPQPNEKVLGGHAVMCIGYDDEKQVFICRNSWGNTWGDKGNFYMPYDYLTNPDLASDFWTIRLL
ncbi:MAG: C1 family peptidase [Parafilimonas sp.]|nr:C1 family peptidase [Parafilimonas sp.]